jgi:asparagine synthase (glutamine-hydrolysing)
MTDVMRHRGPDDRGVFVDTSKGIALGHRRLSIVDLSPTGAQPMRSEGGRFVIVLNGEIYNFREIRKELEACGIGSWRGTSDTEVLLRAIEMWGVSGALARCDGMFAFALWDNESGELTVARDRFGEKPLFLARVEGGLLFASELSGIMEHPSFIGEIDDRSIDRFLALSYIPEPYAPFRNVQKLPPATYATFRSGKSEILPQVYWSATEEALASRRAQELTPVSNEDLMTQIEDRLSVVIRNQMLADVPLGAFLSGGIDSSLIVALMQKASARPIKTFTIGFNDEAYDEALFARSVAERLGTEHTEVRVTWQDALNIVEKLPEIYDEPFADSSQLPTYLVSAGARRDVTVALTGDAGDEIFGGYNRHRVAMSYERFFSDVPLQARRFLSSTLSTMAESRTLDVVDRMFGAVGLRRRVRLVGEKASKLSSFLGSQTGLQMYLELIRRDESLIAVDAYVDTFATKYALMEAEGLRFAEVMMLLDTETYLPGDILTKVDRASMAVALETRAPFLDHRLFSLAWRMPIDAKIHKGKTKNVLRTLLVKHLPESLFERPKAGFGVPIASWLRGSLREWMLAHVNDFKVSYPRHAMMVDQALAAQDRGSPTVHHLLWSIAVLQMWTVRWRRPIVKSPVGSMSEAN